VDDSGHLVSDEEQIVVSALYLTPWQCFPFYQLTENVDQRAAYYSLLDLDKRFLKQTARLDTAHNKVIMNE
jgi:hypothetical protein